MKTLVFFLFGSVALVWLSSSVYAETKALTVDRAMTHQDAETLLAKRGHDKGHPGKGPGQRGKGSSEEEFGHSRASEGKQERERNSEGDGQEHDGPEAANGDEENGEQAAKGQKKLKQQDKKKGLDRADEAAGEHGEHGRSKAREQR